MLGLSSTARAAAAALLAAACLAGPAQARACPAPEAPDLYGPAAEMDIDAIEELSDEMVAYSYDMERHRECLELIVEEPEEYDEAAWLDALDGYNGSSAVEAEAWDEFEELLQEWRDHQELVLEAARKNAELKSKQAALEAAGLAATE